MLLSTAVSEIILQFLHSCNTFIWGAPMLCLLMGTHLFFTIRLRFVQRHVFRGIRYSVTSEEETGKTGRHKGFSGLASLSTILAATIGIGNIVGISTAVALGGPGAVLWCWLTGILGMATSFAECYLGIFYREKTKDGQYVGGPMYVLEKGLHCRPLALFFAFCTVTASLGVGCSVQARSASEALFQTLHIPPVVTGFLLAVPIGFVLIGGVGAVSKVCMKLVPAMGVFYLGGCFFILFLNRDYLLPSVSLIFRSAFLPQAAAGGFIGSTIILAARYGVARGLFTNEAGLGSAPIAAAGADTKDPVRQSLISMTATFWDTVVLCGITGIAIVSHVMRYPDTVAGLPATELTASAFATIPFIGTPMLTLSIVAFVFATIIGWFYFGERAFLYLFRGRGFFFYRVAYIVMVFLGSTLSMNLIWELSDTVNALMAVPNLIAVLILAKKIPDGKNCR